MTRADDIRPYACQGYGLCFFGMIAELPIETSLTGDVEMKEARMPKPSAKQAPSYGAMVSR